MKRNVMINPVNCEYRYQWNKNPVENTEISVNREAADPSVVYFKEKYYMFVSMSLSVWVSDDLVHWESYRLPEKAPVYDYAPDVCVYRNYVYISACTDGRTGCFYRTKDIVNGPYEEIESNTDFMDPALFVDEDEKMYLFSGCSTEPIWGVEINPETMQTIGEKRKLIFPDPWKKGYERIGEDNALLPKTKEEVENKLQSILEAQGICKETTDQAMITLMKDMLSDSPYIEGAWMNKYNGRYYLQYAFAGTQYNTYGDGVYVSDHPLGPYVLAENNPYSYSPGSFFPGAGHGSTFQDKYGNYWHAATMRISVNHSFERRVGIWPAGFDEDGELFCNQRYGDWPKKIIQEKFEPWISPYCYLLSYKKNVMASSWKQEHIAGNVADENVQTWWCAENNDIHAWIQIDLGKEYMVEVVQINFADNDIHLEDQSIFKAPHQNRYIEERHQRTRWILEGSLDGDSYEMLEDKSNTETNLSHDVVILDGIKKWRYLKLTVIEVPYNQNACISGFRVFGFGDGKKPKIPIFNVEKIGEIDMDIFIQGQSDATGYNILWGHSSDKLYHSYLTYETQKRIGALISGMNYYVRVDAFNENGITEGNTIKI